MDENEQAARVVAAVEHLTRTYEARVAGTVLADSDVEFLLDKVIGDLVVRITARLEAEGLRPPTSATADVSPPPDGTISHPEH